MDELLAVIERHQEQRQEELEDAVKQTRLQVAEEYCSAEEVTKILKERMDTQRGELIACAQAVADLRREMGRVKDEDEDSTEDVGRGRRGGQVVHAVVLVTVG